MSLVLISENLKGSHACKSLVFIRFIIVLIIRTTRAKFILTRWTNPAFIIRAVVYIHHRFILMLFKFTLVTCDKTRHLKIALLKKYGNIRA